jgi:hypothetical protein
MCCQKRDRRVVKAKTDLFVEGDGEGGVRQAGDDQTLGEHHISAAVAQRRMMPLSIGAAFLYRRPPPSASSFRRAFNIQGASPFRAADPLPSSTFRPERAFSYRIRSFNDIHSPRHVDLLPRFGYSIFSNALFRHSLPLECSKRGLNYSFNLETSDEIESSQYWHLFDWLLRIILNTYK